MGEANRYCVTHTLLSLKTNKIQTKLPADGLHFPPKFVWLHVTLLPSLPVQELPPSSLTVQRGQTKLILIQLAMGHVYGWLVEVFMVVLLCLHVKIKLLLLLKTQLGGISTMMVDLFGLDFYCPVSPVGVSPTSCPMDRTCLHQASQLTLYGTFLPVLKKTLLHFAQHLFYENLYFS